MRAHEFITERSKTPTILREYRRDITARQYGDKILTTWNRKGDNLNTLVLLLTDAGLMDKGMSTIDMILAAFEHYGDPTPNKIYTPWIAREYSEGNIRRLEDLDSRIKPILEQYHKYKNKGWFPQHAKDIMRVNLNQLISLIMNLHIPNEQINRGQSEEVYRDSDVRVIHPLDQTAACYYGQGTQWCTAATRGTNYFNRYNQQGPLYIILPQNPKYSGEKYQLHFESGQFMNEEDNPVSPKEILVSRFPQLQKLFEKQIEGMLEFAPDEFLKELYDAGVELAAKHFHTEIVESIKNNRHYEYMEWLSKRGVDVDNMTSSDLLRYEKTLGYSFGEFDPGLDETDDALHEMRTKTLNNIHQYIIHGQQDIGVMFNASDIGHVVDWALDDSIDDKNNSYAWKLSTWIQDHITAKRGEYDWQPGKRKFKPFKQVGEWTVGQYV